MLERLPGGARLRDAVRSKRMDDEWINTAIGRHMSLLRDMALDRARVLHLEVKTIVVSYPNYLCEAKEEKDPEKKYYDLEKYLEYYFRILHRT